MTSQTQNNDAANDYRLACLYVARPDAVVSGDKVVARMDAVEADGTYDKDDMGLRRSRQGMVGGARMTCQVAALGTDTLITFWGLADGHQRRLMVDGQGRTWIEVRGRAVRQTTKYDDVIGKIMTARGN